MPDKRVYVIKNTGRAKTYDQTTGLPTGITEEYITSSAGKGVSRSTPIGFSKEVAEEYATKLGFDIEEAVIVAPDDIVVKLHGSARKLPQTEPMLLAQFKSDPVSM